MGIVSYLPDNTIEVIENDGTYRRLSLNGQVSFNEPDVIKVTSFQSASQDGTIQYGPTEYIRKSKVIELLRLVDGISWGDSHEKIVVEMHSLGFSDEEIMRSLELGDPNIIKIYTEREG